MSVIAQLPFRVIKDTGGLAIEYECPMTDPTGRQYLQTRTQFIGSADSPVFGPILRLMEMYREQEKRIAAFDREREALQAEKANLEGQIKSLSAKVDSLQRRK